MYEVCVPAVAHRDADGNVLGYSGIKAIGTASTREVALAIARKARAEGECHIRIIECEG